MRKKIAYSFDNNSYSGAYDTDSEALREALREIEYIRKYHPECVPGSVYIGVCEFFEPSLYGSGLDVIEAAKDQACDEGFDEWADDYLSDIPDEQLEELEKGLEKVFLDWIHKHNHHANFYKVNSYDIYLYSKEKHRLYMPAEDKPVNTAEKIEESKRLKTDAHPQEVCPCYDIPGQMELKDFL